MLQGNMSRAPVMKKVQVHYQVNTKNLSFIKMYNTLKKMGVVNNKFHLVLYDSRLMNVDPHDPHIPIEYQAMILQECRRNFWYFIREVVRINEPGSPTGISYQLHRGNLTMNYCLTRNLNIYLELPRQNGKTISAVAWYLWVFLLGTSNSQAMFATKTKDFAKENLKRLKKMKDVLPHYFDIKHFSEVSGKELKSKDNVETMENIDNNNSIVTMPSARNKTHADQLARGATQPLQWYDEYAFIPYNEIVYASAAPAFSQASLSAKRNGKPYSMLMTSTPGDMAVDMGKDAYQTIINSTKFDNCMFDMRQSEIEEYIKRNGRTPFVYIRFMYYDLGRDEEWFQHQCSLLKYKWSDIKREILLEWAKGSSECPFSEEELDMVESHVKPPLRIIHINKYYPVAIFEEVNLAEPQIIGVDVSGGYRRDSSAFVAISSRTTKVQAMFNNNKIGLNELSYLLMEYINGYSPNALLVVERNSYGEGVLSNLRKTNVANNLYFAYNKDDTRDKVREGFKVQMSVMTKEYGVYTTPKVRETIFDLLRDRVTYHYDKFISYTILEEMRGLIFDPRKGRVDHSANTHDDSIMAMMMAVYVYYYGTSLHNFGITRRDVPKFGENSDSIEDISSSLIDPIYAAESSLKLNKILPKKYSTHQYRKWVESESFERKDEIDARLMLKSMIGTGKLMHHMNTGKNSSDMFSRLNNNVDPYEETRQNGGLIYDMEEDNLQDYIQGTGDYANGNNNYEEQEEYVDPNDNIHRFNFMNYLNNDDKRPIQRKY